MSDDETHHLLRSLKDERDLVLLPRLQRLEKALKQIRALAHEPHSQRSKLHVLVEISELADKALTL